MKQLDGGLDQVHQEDSSSRGRNPYRVLFGTPGAFAFSSTGFVGRMSMSMYGLGTVLLIASITGKYGIAGTVAASGSIGFALLSPYVAKLSDRLGQGRVLLAEVTIFTIACAAFITCAEMRAPLPALLVAGTLAGACMPSMSSMVRSRWSSLLSDRPRQLHAAFALESVNDEIIFVIGPALVTLLATQLFPAAGVGTASVLAIAGTVLFAFQRRTEPAPRPRPLKVAKRGSMPAAGLITLSPAFLMLGMMFSSIDLSTVAFASELGHRPLAGLILGTYSLGSAIGGFWYGSKNWRSPLGRRFIITAAITVCGVATFWAMPGLLALDVVCLFAGLAVAPTLIAGYAILEQQAEPHRRTEAMAWLGSTISVGIAVGSAIAGHIIDADGARVSYAFAALCGTLAVLICLTGQAKLRINREPRT
ncbi:MAG TPA: MFS transporter [Streptosporangiaceae bacterium]|nr:MFS transporter [Streptosporangiaceae bacterium]